MIIILLPCLAFVTLSANNTVEPIWLTSDYLRAGNRDVIHNLTGSDADPVPTFTFTFSSPLSGVPDLGYGIKNYEGGDYIAQEFF